MTVCFDNWARGIKKLENGQIFLQNSHKGRTSCNEGAINQKCGVSDSE